MKCPDTDTIVHYGLQMWCRWTESSLPPRSNVCWVKTRSAGCSISWVKPSPPLSAPLLSTSRKSENILWRKSSPSWTFYALKRWDFIFNWYLSKPILRVIRKIFIVLFFKMIANFFLIRCYGVWKPFENFDHYWSLDNLEIGSIYPQISLKSKKQRRVTVDHGKKFTVKKR